MNRDRKLVPQQMNRHDRNDRRKEKARGQKPSGMHTGRTIYRLW